MCIIIYEITNRTTFLFIAKTLCYTNITNAKIQVVT